LSIWTEKDLVKKKKIWHFYYFFVRRYNHRYLTLSP
jgi:hypothetical protein